MSETLIHVVFRSEQLTPKVAGQAFNIPAQCADMTFINLGVSTALVNGFPIAPGAVYVLACNRLEYNDDMTVQVTCNAAAGGGNQGLWVVRKYYTGKTSLVERFAK